MSPLVQRMLFFAGLLCLLHIHESSALICYDCNSEFDPRCADPFEPYSIGEVNCSKQDPLEHLKDKYKPTLCRKTTQKIYGKTRIVRGCGYIPDERDDKECVKRLGTHDVQAIYCACTTDLCNAATSSRFNNSYNNLLNVLPLALTVIVFTILCNFNLIQKS